MNSRHPYHEPEQPSAHPSQAEDEYMISDADLFVTRYVSVPRELGQLNCAAFVAGIIRGSLTGSGFSARCGGRW